MKKDLKYNQIAAWTEIIQAKGRYSFHLSELKQENKALSDNAVKFALKRLSDKGKVISVFKGYYLIIPPKYRSKGILPPTLYLHDFMKHLRRPYYLGLLNAAAFHGAAHQQPQEYFVITNFPTLRPTKKKGLKVNYISIKDIPEELIEKRNTEAGYLHISNPILTACDLIQFEKRVGGLNRAATVLNELAEIIKPSDLSPRLIQHSHITTLQRLGFLLENVLPYQQLAEGLYEAVLKENLKFYRIPLKASKDIKGFSSDARWKVVVNTEIEIDE
jgi:predicted transcriptional regulator of viral defense system